MDKIKPATPIVKRPRSTRVRKPNVRTSSPDTVKAQDAKAQDVKMPACQPLNPILVLSQPPPAAAFAAAASPPAAPRPCVLSAPQAALAANKHVVTTPPPPLPVPDPPPLGDNAGARTQALSPDIISITPGGAAWWKTGALMPESLVGVHLALQQPGSMWPPGVTTQINFMKNLRYLAHHAEARQVRDLLLTAKEVMVGYEVATFRGTFSSVQSPTLEHLDETRRIIALWEQFCGHAAMHTLVGNGSVAAKIATFDALRELKVGLAQVCMLDLSMLHIACIVPMPANERATLIQYLKWAGCASSVASDAGLTPLHCLAAQPDAIPAMEALFAPYPDISAHVKSPISVNARTSEGRTPLFIAYATQPENAAVIAWLEGRGANLRARTNDNETMLHAVLRHGDHPEVVASLVRRSLSIFSGGGERATLEQLCRDLHRPKTLEVVDQAFKFTHPLRTVQRPYLGSTLKTAVPPPGPLAVPV